MPAELPGGAGADAPATFVGIVLTNAHNPFFHDLAAGAEALASERGHVVLVGSSVESDKREAALLALLADRQVGGLLISPVATDEATLARLGALEVPAVLMDRDFPGASLLSVSVDDLVGGALAVSHLATLGHRRIAFVGAPAPLHPVEGRYQGALEEAERRGVRLELIRTTGHTLEDGVRAGKEIARRLPHRRPTAVFAANDLVAIGMLRALTVRGLGVPDDVALVGYDDIQFAATASVPLTSVAQPRHQIGRTAMQLLLDAMEGRPATESVVLEPSLVVRSSTGFPHD